MNQQASRSVSVPFLCAAAALFAACSSGLGGPGSGQSGNADSSSARATGLGIDLGTDLSDPIQDDFAIAGALIPGVTEDLDRRIALVAFTTNSRADNASGAGAPLVRDNVSQLDNNGGADVFLMAIEDELIDRGPMGMQPAAFSRALVNTFRHDRCVTCHALGTLAGPGEELAFPGAPHPGGAEPVMIETCNTCHSPANVADLAGFEWRSPLEANGDFDFRGNTVEELATKAMSVPLEGHLLDDGRVRWAIESGNVPFVAPRAGGNAGSSSLWNGFGRDVGAVPISFGLFRAQLLAWEEGGFQVTAESSVRDVALVSRTQFANAASNGASSQPALTWVPNPAFDPADPTAAAAGDVVIVYTSDATDLVSGTQNRTNVYRVRMPLFIDRDPATGAVSVGDLDLSPNPTSHELISLNSAATGESNGDSSSPSISADGEDVAFMSTGNNLVAGFSDQNGASGDIYVRTGGGSTLLVSAAVGTTTTGGDFGSSQPSLSSTGTAVAFASSATNLVSDDTNGEQDVFYTRVASGAIEPIVRASVRPSGVEGTGGACLEPSVAVTSDGTIVVAFTSDKTNLSTIAGATSNVYTADSRPGNVGATLLSQLRSGGAGTAGNGLSDHPRISPNGDSLLYSTAATNLDASRPTDQNAAMDVMLVDLRTFRASGNIQGRRISVDSLGQDGGDAADRAEIATFRDATGSLATSTFSVFRTAAENLGATRQDVVTTFLNDADTVVRTDFAADVVAGVGPLNVMFTDTSNGEPNSWSWDFGDGGTSTDQNPSHVYNGVGEYDVTLTVTRPGSGSESVQKTGFIRVLEPLSITGFSGDNLSGPRPLTSTFTPVFSGSEEGIEYSWTFGDGATSTERAPTHTYTVTGVYSVTLAVTGLAGSDSVTRFNYINVTDPSGANFTTSSNGLRITFVNQSSGSPTSFTWDFGDGGSSNQEDPVHDYDSNGVRMVTLTINGPGGMDSITRAVTVNAREFSTVRTILNSNGCQSCHGSSGGLTMTGTNLSVYNELYNVSAEGSDCTGAGRRRVIPFNATGSLLVQTVDPGVTACNAGNGMGSFNSTDLAILREWINEGATFD